MRAVSGSAESDRRDPCLPLNMSDPTLPHRSMPPIPIAGSSVFVTGADGGLGAEFVAQAIDRGAARVHATTLRSHRWSSRLVRPLVVDIRDEASVTAAAMEADDTTIVINNAGTGSSESLTTGDLEQLRNVVETNLWGSLHVVRAFAPVLEANGGGTIINVLSAAAWDHRLKSYSVSKAALWAATNGMRMELAPRGVRVVGLILSFTDTPMVRSWFPGASDLNDPADVVRTAYDRYEAGALEILADAHSQRLKAELSGPPVGAAFDHD